MSSTDHDAARDGDVLRPLRGRENDPTLMRNQPALRASSGNIWVIVGALFLAVGLTVFTFTLQLRPGLSWAAIATIVILFAAMVAVRFAVADHRKRLLALVVLLLAMATVSLMFAIIVNAQEWAAIASRL